MPQQIITRRSPRADQPPGAALDLWAHQLAMLNRCLTIEDTRGGTEGALGVVGDEPGAGKTYVMIALHLATATSPTDRTLVVVPHNIYGQWQRDIARYAPGLKTMLFVDYEAITSVYAKGADHLFEDADIVLTTSLYYQTIATALERSECVPFMRTVFDEADSTSNMLRGPTIPSRFVWLVTASFERLVDHRGIVRAGPYSSPSSALEGCRCDSEFVAQSILLDDPVLRIVECESPHIGIIASMFPNQPTVVHTYDFSTLINREVKSVREALSMQIKILEDEVEYCKKSIEASREGSKTDRLQERLQKASETLENALARISDANMCPICMDACLDSVSLPCCRSSTFCRDCIVDWINARKYPPHRSRANIASCPLCRATITKKFLPSEFPKKSEDLPGSDFPKVTETLSILKRRFKESPDTRAFVFSNNSVILSTIGRLALTEMGIRSVALDGGTADSIDKDVLEYQTGKAQIMLADASLFGCGMNFPETTDMIIMHHMTEIQERQVIGRAQRPGRKSTLRIYKMLHEDEIHVPS